MRRPKFHSSRTARTKDGRLKTSREPFCSWTHLQHLEEDTANQDAAENPTWGTCEKLRGWSTTGGTAQPLILNQSGDSLSGSEDEKRVGDDDRQPLEEDRGRAGVVQVLHRQHVSVKVLSHVGQTELKPGEQRRVVQSPFWRVLQQNKEF